MDEKSRKLALSAIQTRNPRMIYEIAFLLEVDDEALLNKMAEIVIKSHNLEYIYKMATIKGTPTLKLARAIAASGSLKWIRRFAENVGNAPQLKLAEAYVMNARAEDILEYASCVDNAPLEFLAEAILETDDERCIEEFAINVLGMDIQRFKNKFGDEFDCEEEMQ